MSKEINSIDDLVKTSEETEVVEEKTSKKVNSYKAAAIERAEAAEDAAKEAEQAAIDRKRLEDGREYEFEVEGFNIGDSLMRRAQTLDENTGAIKEALDEEELEESVSSEFDSDNEEEDFDDMLFDSEEDGGDEENFDNEVEETVVKNEKVEDKTVEFPSQDSFEIDDEDLDDIDLEIEEDATDEDTDSDELTEAETNALRRVVKEKLKITTVNATDIKVSNKAVPLSTVLAQQNANAKVSDFPLISAGKNVSMKAFSGTEIESLNRSNTGRNRFNTMKEIYRTIWDHIVDANKPDFESWLKVTSFMDIECLYMAIYKASFGGANYVPYNCDKEEDKDACGNIFLSDNIDVTDMIKFKDDATKKRFFEIYENSDVTKEDKSALYETTIIPVTDTIAIGFREPSIYNTVFENSVLDQKFVDKYTDLLTIMVYIDNMYLIQGNEYIPIKVKSDKSSVAKTAKYRIASYAKIIKALPSDAYNKIVLEAAKINQAGDVIQFQIPETVCPKCGRKIDAQVQNAMTILFSRHQLNLFSQQ